MNILAADDEPNILTLISAILSKEGHNVYKAKDGEEALDIFYANSVDMIICDEMMPGVSGNELVEAVRKENPSVPIIMVTARGMLEDKARSFSLGVDDYMVKPIECGELLMRVNAIARRARINTDRKISVGGTVLDSNSHTVENAARGQHVQLTKTEFDILYKLLSYSERAYTKWQLLDEFWGGTDDRDEGIVKVFIFKIRKQIEPFPEIGIKTVMGVGYQGVRNENI